MATKISRFLAKNKEYNDILKVYNLRRREQEKVWLEIDLVPKLQDVFIQEKCTPKCEFKILAVGSNVGSLDVLLIKALFSHAKELMEGKQVIYTVVEPNSAAIDEFKHDLSLQDGIFRNVIFNWVNKGVQEFLDAKEPEQYDLVHFMHVLYYIENEEDVLKRVYEKFLAIPGCILIATGSEDGIWLNLIESFKTMIPSLPSKQETNVLMSEICKRNGWTYEIFDAKVDLEVTEVFNERDPVGTAVLQFLFRIHEEPKDKFGKELMSEILEFFERMSWEKTKGGKRYLFVKEDDGVLLIYKRS